MASIGKWLHLSRDRTYEDALRAYDQGLLPKAIELLNSCLGALPDAATTRLCRFYLSECYGQLGQTSLVKGSFDKAAQYFRSSCEYQPTYPDLHFFHALSLAKVGKPAEATAAIGRALKINPQFGRAILLQAVLWIQSGRLNDGRKRLQAAAAADPKLSELVSKAQSTFENGAAADALDSLLNALCETGDSKTPGQSADQAFNDGNYASALEIYCGAIADNRGYADLHCKAGQCLMELERFAEASEYFRRALEINPKYLDAQYHLARALLAQGQTDAAGAMIRQVLSLEPDHAGAQSILNDEAA